MPRRYRISIRFIKRDHGSGKLTWRIASATDHGAKVCIRRVSNKLAKRLLYAGSSVKAY